MSGAEVHIHPIKALSGFNLAIERLFMSGCAGGYPNRARLEVSISQSRGFSCQGRATAVIWTGVNVSISQSRGFSFQVMV